MEPTIPTASLERANSKSLFRRIFGRGRSAKETRSDRPAPPEILAASKNPDIALEAASDIRLLILLPGTRGDPIQITLLAADIQALACPNYDALTYAWGHQFYAREVIVNGREHPVTKNLYEALEHLRHRTESRLLWIDAICINMRDMKERSRQIRLMRAIFQKARRVLVWLGPENEDSDLAFKTLEVIHHKIQIDWTSCTVKAVSENSNNCYNSTDWADHDSGIPFEPGALLAITRLLQRPLFSRLWIWQEVHLASNQSVVIAGHESISLEHFRNAIWYLAWKRIYDTKSIAHMRESLLSVLAMVDKVKDKSLRSLIESTRHCHCSDSRDRIYGLLAITETPTLVVPDYSKSVLQVYTEVTQQHILELLDMNILTSCEMVTETDWPTWVPDWTTPSACAQQFTGLYTAGDTCPGVKYINDDILEVYGVLIDQVDVEHLNIISEQDAIGRIQILISRYGIMEPEGLFRTLCGNRFSNRYIPQRESLLSSSMSKKAVSDLIKAEDSASQTELGVHVRKFVREFQTMAHGRCFLKTTNGYTGLGPQGVRAGDIVCVLLGCNTPMILRPSSKTEGAFEVIGAAYVDGFTEAQALLGPLPVHTSFVYQYNEKRKTFQAAYLDERTQKTTLNDPRLGPLPPGWRIKRYPEENAHGIYENDTGLLALMPGDTEIEPRWEETFYDPRLTTQALIKRGVNLQTFRLV